MHPASKKATATVSLSNASAVGTATPCLFPTDAPQNLIPFPSCTPATAVPCITPPELDLDLLSFVVIERDGEEGMEKQSMLRAATAWRIDLRRRRSKSCLVPASFICGAPSQNDFSLHLDVPGPRRSQSVTESRPRVVKKKPVSSSPKATRKAKKLTADVHFVAMMHKSIVCWTKDGHSEPPPKEPLSDILQQDGLLVQRLWRGLLAQGLKPIPFESDNKIVPEPVPSSPPPPYTLSSEVDLTQTAQPLPRLSIPQTVVKASRPTSSPVRSEPVPDVLTMPQLIATLILRHNDRRSARPRSAAAVRRHASQDSPPTHVRPRSPLSKVVAGNQDQDMA
ncbi:hypothetical protein EUX98_g5168 [Antrodiella citrinella]|uniref:Uncharacterized protein n=1 Tax=Antrodiella citrinella TaxID=2447956 RepID=A0A4S4MUZ1_9APHY|nr:hypothetical protein EUX98_g5168 [Antrodiella citrinella]